MIKLILLLFDALGSIWVTLHTENSVHNPKFLPLRLGYGHHLPPPQIMFDFQLEDLETGVGHTS